jgi:hypothetical protein
VRDFAKFDAMDHEEDGTGSTTNDINERSIFLSRQAQGTPTPWAFFSLCRGGSLAEARRESPMRPDLA